MRFIINTLKIILGRVYFPVFQKIAIKRIKEKSNCSLEENYDWISSFSVGPRIRGLNLNFKPSQIKEEYLELLNSIVNLPLKRILEIGTATGGTLFMLSRAAQPDAQIISIDLPFGKYGAGYLPYRIPLLEAFAQPNQKILLLREDSHNATTKNKLESILSGESLDFIFIDGDHTYSGVKKDFEDYKKYVRKGGVMAFHDISPNDQDDSFGTQRFWLEIKSCYKYKEIIRSDNRSGCGIGLIFID